jgi:hypothetical protein
MSVQNNSHMLYPIVKNYIYLKTKDMITKYSWNDFPTVAF